MKLSKQKAMEGVGKTKLLQKPMVVKDPRFSRLHSDPRFQRTFKRKLKIPIDSRFSHIFSDKRFSDPLALDKRGRKPRKQSHKHSKKGNALQQYYHLHDGDDGDEASPAEIPSNDGHVAPEANFSKATKNGENPFSEAHQNDGKTQKHSKKKAKKEPLSSEAMPPHADVESLSQDNSTQRRSLKRLLQAHNVHHMYESLMESITPLQNCLVPSTFPFQAQSSQTQRWRVRPGRIRASRLEEETIALRTCRNCKKQFNPSENHPRACFYHTAHFGGETRRKFESVHTGGTMDTPGGGKITSYWHCCASENPFDPGCVAGPHASYDD